MLAIVDFEHEEDKRVFGYSRNPAPHYVNLREATRRAVEEAGAPAAPTDEDHGSPARNAPGREVADGRDRTALATTIAFRSFSGEPTATLPNRACAGRVPCFSTRDGHSTPRWPTSIGGRTPNPPGNC